MKVYELNVATDFAVLPFGRYKEDGKFNATRFREEFLVPAIRSNDVVKVNMDGVSDSISSSFLNESFAGLVFKSNIAKDILLSKIQIISDREDLKAEIIQYIKNA